MEEYGLETCYDPACESCHPTKVEAFFAKPVIDNELGKRISEDFAEYYHNSDLVAPSECIDAYIQNTGSVADRPAYITDQMVREYLMLLYNLGLDKLANLA